MGSTPVLQYCWKNTGKKPASTVVAKAELAQSYSAQETVSRRLYGLDMSVHLLSRLAKYDVRPTFHGQIQIDS